MLNLISVLNRCQQFFIKQFQENGESSSGVKQSAKLKILPVQLDELDDMDDDVKEQQWRYVLLKFGYCFLSTSNYYLLELAY